MFISRVFRSALGSAAAGLLAVAMPFVFSQEPGLDAKLSSIPRVELRERWSVEGRVSGFHALAFSGDSKWLAVATAALRKYEVQWDERYVWD